MQTSNPQELEAKVEARYRTFLVLWAAILMSIGFLLALASALPVKASANPIISYTLLIIGTSVVGVSVLLKQKMAQQAIDKGSVQSLQSAHVVSLALCESAALLGLCDRLMTGSVTSWFLFGIAVVGLLLHFPKKDYLRAVIHKAD
ncbi:MAG: hypothetical protein ACXW18_00880 [Pyrinomonadaceae bacterium]